MTSRSLILLDEIGSSTEPGEGAALARAVLEQFREIGALTIATTHYNRLKIYAETTQGVANAAMEFNEITLEPTYRLIHGLSGASSGLKIAERLQLPVRVLKAATGFLDATEADAAHYVDELRQRIVDLENEKARVEKEQKDFEDAKHKELSTLTAQHKDEIAKAEKKLERIVQEVSERASRELEIVKDDSVKKFQKKLASVKAQAHNEINREKEKLQPKSPASPSLPPAEPRRPLPGAQARVISLGVTGTVTSVKGDEAELLIGNIKMRRPIEDLEVVEKGPIKLPPGVHLTVSTKELESNEINLLGRRVDEAIDLVDKFLDDAFLSQMKEVRVVHGTGTGALRQAILELLASHPHVGSFEAAAHAQGGRGVTIVTLRN